MIRRWYALAVRLRDRSRAVRWGLRAVGLVGILGLGGLLVSASGVVPIGASSGHWAITRGFLQFSKERSISTHTLGVTAPPLDEPWLVPKGAAYYDHGCRPCHGSPELREPPIARHMEPIPPYLSDTVARWTPEELFYAIKHGIKLTGMPAWPSQQRDDEVWAMVAFLRALPGMDAPRYRQLATGEFSRTEEAIPLTALDPAAGPAALAARCAPCHGVGGGGRGEAAIPALAGQRPHYLVASLEAFAQGRRHSGIMEPFVAGLSADQIRELARHYAGARPPTPAPPAEPDAIARGESIARRGVPESEVPACAPCHGPTDEPRNPTYPLLDAQPADYLVLQLGLFKGDQRGGTPYAHLMRLAAAGLSTDQMRDVARYYASRALEGAPAGR